MEEGERRALTFWVWLTSNHSNCSPSTSRNSCAFLQFCPSQLRFSYWCTCPFLNLEKRIIQSPIFGTLNSRRGKEEKKALEGMRVQKEGKEKGRRVDNGKRSRGWHSSPQLIVCTVTSYLNSGPSQNLLLETAFLTHFSLGFLLFMMKSFVKERKIENKVCSAISRKIPH